MKADRVIANALKRARETRGLRTIGPNDRLSESHIRKADHNLIVMTDLNKLGHEDWVVISAYYAMYHASLAVLTKVGLNSKEHAATAAVLEYFFGKEIGRELVGRFNELEERYINYLWKVKREREKVQYGVSLSYGEAEGIMKNARDFVSRLKLVRGEIDGEVIAAVGEEISRLKKRRECRPCWGRR